MSRTTAGTTNLRQRLPRLLLAAGFGLIAAGLALELAGLGAELMPMLGLGGSIFGLLAKLGGPFVFAGLFALAVRGPGLTGPGSMAAPKPDRLARIAAVAAQQARKRPVSHRGQPGAEAAG